MNWKPIKQQTKEWYDLKVGKVSGTRFGQVISGRKNALNYELLNEKLNGYIEQTDYINEDMQYGLDNEETALSLYEQMTGIKFERGGVIFSDFSDMHMSSPDAVNIELGVVCEVKCTMNGAKHLQRHFEGVETNYMPQIKNYFACSDSVKEVHFISYCGYRPEREIIVKIFKREEFEDEILKARKKLVETIEEVTQMYKSYIF